MNMTKRVLAPMQQFSALTQEQMAHAIDEAIARGDQEMAALFCRTAMRLAKKESMVTKAEDDDAVDAIRERDIAESFDDC